jgi:hypothetical protein
MQHNLYANATAAERPRGAWQGHGWTAIVWSLVQFPLFVPVMDKKTIFLTNPGGTTLRNCHLLFILTQKQPQQAQLPCPLAGDCIAKSPK